MKNLENLILSNLESGMSEEEIAKVFTESLNRASSKFNEIDEKKEDTRELMNHINEYFKKYYPGSALINNLNDEDVEDLMKLIDSINHLDSIIKLTI